MNETPESRRLLCLRSMIAAIFEALKEFDLSASSPENARNVIRGLSNRLRPDWETASLAVAEEAADRVIDCLNWR